MAIRNYLEFSPKIAETAYVDEMAVVIGNCELAEDVSIWPTAVLRGDVNKIKIGARTNIQDGVIVHVTNPTENNPEGAPTTIGEDVTIGHRAILHGCRIDNECLIGMGAVILDNAHIPSHVFIGANSLIPEGKVLESGYLYLGSPARRVRELTAEEKSYFKVSAQNYVTLKNRHLSS